MIDLLVNLLGLGLIAFIVWWFWLWPRRRPPNDGGDGV